MLYICTNNFKNDGAWECTRSNLRESKMHEGVYTPPDPLDMVWLWALNKHTCNLQFWPTWVVTRNTNCIRLLLHWSLEMWYMHTCPGSILLSLIGTIMVISWHYSCDNASFTRGKSIKGGFPKWSPDELTSIMGCELAMIGSSDMFQGFHSIMMQGKVTTGEHFWIPAAHLEYSILKKCILYPSAIDFHSLS